MPDEPTNETANAEARDDWTVLCLLMDHRETPWSIDEIGREYGDSVAALDAIARLHGAGLIHRTEDGFAFVTRAAARYHEIAA